MKTAAYMLKISPQGQVTLPKDLRDQLRLQPGSRVTVTVQNGKMHISNEPPIRKHFGAMPHLWTGKDQDAAGYTRELRDGMQPKV